MMKGLFLSIAILLSHFSHGQVIINEICPANADVIHDPDFFNFSGWVELHNNGAADLDLGGYFLSDNSGNPWRWSIPAGTIIPKGGYLLVWCDGENSGLHTDFKLDADGEEVVLSGPDQIVVDKVVFGKQHTNVSFARVPGSNVWAYQQTPTPLAQNSSDNASTVLEEVVYSIPGGLHAGAINLQISHPRPGITIRYTLNGAEPDENSAVYGGALNIDKTTIVKAKAYLTNFIPGKTAVQTYLIAERAPTLPVISISMNPAYLNDDMIGIYTVGTNGEPGHGLLTPANWNRPWYRHADVEFFTAAGQRTFHQSVDLRIFGNLSRRYNQKSFAIKARDKYGKKTIDQNLFPHKPIDETGGFVLRNSGTEWNVTMFRDALLHNLVQDQFDIDYLDYQPYSIYLNGAYWGILNLREKLDGDYFESNYNLKEEEVDLLENASQPELGSADMYKLYLDSLNRINLKDPEAIRFIGRHIDIQEFINYQVTNIYTANVDWPGNNIKYWRPKKAGGKFRWILYDMDLSFGYNPLRTYPTHPTLEYAINPKEPGALNPDWSTRHLRLLLQNPVFRSRFIQTITTATATTFKPERVIQIIDKFQSGIRNEMPFHKQRWGGTMAGWDFEVQRLRDFASQRNAFMKDHIEEYFALIPETVNMQIKLAPEEAGIVQTNGVAYSTNVDLQYHKGLPVNIDVVEKEGYRFKKLLISRTPTVKQSILSRADVWHYNDQGITAANDWTFGEFSTWKSGQAPLGYGGKQNTTIGYGPSGANKYITTYFRKDIDISSTDFLDVYASVLADDGVIIYVNGVEVYRDNMPEGAVTNTTLSLKGISWEPVFHHFKIAKELFIQGRNTIAAEVHQQSGASSDLIFDLEIFAVRGAGPAENIESNQVVFGDTVYFDLKVEAMFEKIPEVKGIVINEISAAKTSVKDNFGENEDWIELYNAGAETIDVGGLYITDNLSEKMKHRIPVGDASTIIQPGGYLLLWADDQTQQGPTHLSFRLSADGEAVGLYQFNGTAFLTIDETTFGSQNDGESWSRSPNGSGPFFLTSNITPGAANFEDVVEPLWDIYPNPTTGIVNVQSNTLGSRISIHDAWGRLIREYVDISSQDKLELTDLNPGIYILKTFNGTKEFIFRLIKI